MSLLGSQSSCEKEEVLDGKTSEDLQSFLGGRTFEQRSSTETAGKGILWIRMGSPDCHVGEVALTGEDGKASGSETFQGVCWKTLR